MLAQGWVDGKINHVCVNNTILLIILWCEFACIFMLKDHALLKRLTCLAFLQGNFAKGREAMGNCILEMTRSRTSSRFSNAAN